MSDKLQFVAALSSTAFNSARGLELLPRQTEVRRTKLSLCLIRLDRILMSQRESDVVETFQQAILLKL
jgi:hypothetical protein